MRLQLTEWGMVIFSFDVAGYEMAKKLIRFAIADYKEAGFDTSDLERVLAKLDDTHTTIQ